MEYAVLLFQKLSRADILYSTLSLTQPSTVHFPGPSPNPFPDNRGLYRKLKSFRDSFSTVCTLDVTAIAKLIEDNFSPDQTPVTDAYFKLSSNGFAVS